MFKSKVVLVTGSSTGIGAGIAIKFASEGASGVVLHGRKEDALKSVKEQCEKAGHGNTKVHYVIGDITKQDVREKMVNETIEKFGRLDVLVNNAGIMNATIFTEAKIDAYDQIFDVNVRSMIILTQLAVPHLINSKGNIVNMSSLGGLKAVPIFVYYCMAKAAVDHFTRCLAVDLGPKGVRVNSINPSYIKETELGRLGAAAAAETSKALIAYAEEKYPLRRAGIVDDVADAVSYLASDKAKFVTGVNFPVDGGALHV